MAGDSPGQVYDGETPLSDDDFTDEATAVTIHFTGFSIGQCEGISHYEWAVGTDWTGEEELENVMEFTERGIVVTDITTGTGYAQV